MYVGSIEGCREGEYRTALLIFVGLDDFVGDLVGDEIREGDMVGEILEGISELVILDGDAVGEILEGILDEGFRVGFTDALVVGNTEKTAVDIDGDNEVLLVSWITVGEFGGIVKLPTGNQVGDTDDLEDGTGGIDVTERAGEQEGDTVVDTVDLED